MFNKINENIERLIEAENKKKVKKAWKHNLKIGDIFRASWGYDQTNIDYYEVIKLVGKTMVEVCEIEQDREYTGDMQGRCIPLAGHYLNKKPKRFKVKNYDNKPYISVYSFANAYQIEPVKIAPGVEVFKADHWKKYA